MRHWLSPLTQFVFFALCCSLTVYTAWVVFIHPYLSSPVPLGGDYFHALTLVNFFKHHPTFPPLGWLPYWNEGQSVVGGYPWLSFYLTLPFTYFFDTATSMDYFSLLSFGLFTASALWLFYHSSRNWLVAASHMLVLLSTKATYYQLTTGGFIASFTGQWYLPLTLLLALDNHLTWAALVVGLSFWHHAAANLLFVYAPVVVLLVCQKKIKQALTFTWVSWGVGAMGLYTWVLQTFYGSGGSNCTSPQCWGIYPKHLLVWFSATTPALVLTIILVVLIFKAIKPHTISLSVALPVLCALGLFVLYDSLAYFHLINGLANVIFPTRTFWALQLTLFTTTCLMWQSVQKHFTYVAYLSSGVLLLALSIFIFSKPPQIHLGATDTVPDNAATYTLPKYATRPITDLLPDELLSPSPNWRLDSFQPGLNFWLNTVSTIPQVRGPSNHPLGLHRDWQYFLQVSTRANTSTPTALNDALFLIDHYGIKYVENSVSGYPTALLSKPDFASAPVAKRDFTYITLSDHSTSPIVSPTFAPPVLFVGDTVGFELFQRCLAHANLNSQSLVLVRGPSSIDQLSADQLTNYSLVVLYRFTGVKWSNLAGHPLFVELGGKATSQLPSPPPTFLPAATLTSTSFRGTWHTDFAPLDYNNGPWNIVTATLRPATQDLLSIDSKSIISRSGSVILSGVNLPYHLVQTDNLAETQLFASLLTSLLPPVHIPSEATVNWLSPTQIAITGQFSGVYFKQNYDSGWTAQGLPLLTAGLDFMYIPNLTHTTNLTLRYLGSPTVWLVTAITCFSLLLLVINLFAPKVVSWPLRKAIYLATHMLDE